MTDVGIMGRGAQTLNMVKKMRSHTAHIDEIAQESAEMHCIAQERGWRRNVDLKVLRASGIVEIMGTHEVIQSLNVNFGLFKVNFKFQADFSASYSVC